MPCSKCGTDHDPGRPCPPAQDESQATSTQVVHPAAEPVPPPPPQVRPLTPPTEGAHAIARELADELEETQERPIPLREQDAVPDPLIGTTIGSFKIVRRLGKGGMGTV